METITLTILNTKKLLAKADARVKIPTIPIHSENGQTLPYRSVSEPNTMTPMIFDTEVAAGRMENCRLVMFHSSPMGMFMNVKVMSSSPNDT